MGPETALVVLHENPSARTCGFYLRGETCLSTLAAVAMFIPGDVKIAIYYGHTSSKWDGRGTSCTRSRRWTVEP
jgi:hypothetical protein